MLCWVIWMADLRRATIYTDNIFNNLISIKRLRPLQSIVFPVKANAYGHGIVPVVQAADSLVEGYWVCDLDEAIAVRQHTSKPVILNQYLIDPKEIHEWAAFGLDIAVTHSEQLKMLLEHPPVQPLNVWLKINTGMNRMGIDSTLFQWCFNQLKKVKWCKRITLMTHLADPVNTIENKKQISKFRTLCGNYPWTSYANSGAILEQNDHRENEYIRPGIMSYGVSPFDKKNAEKIELKPAMTVQARIVSINTVRKGESVGYGRLYRAPKKSRIAVVAMGYADGFPRNPQNATVTCQNERFMVVGRASMDTFTIDVTNADSVIQIGDWVTIWGEESPIEDLALKASVSPYVLLTQLGVRVRKYYEVKQTENMA